MTNVRCCRRKIHRPTSLSTMSGQKTRAENCSGPLRAGRVMMVALLVTLFFTETTLAQNESFTFGRSPVGTVPSGAAGGTMVDVNRDGLGFSIRAGHEAGKTVGRDQSASLFEFTPYFNIGNGYLFGDSRLVYANDGGLAWSFGAGYRHYVTAWDAVVGAYGYFDRDEITGAHFKQGSFGAEILAHDWEARANWYEPFGNTSSRTGTRIAPGSERFSENLLLFDRIDTFAEALKGFDAEFGFLLPGKFAERFDVRAFVGGYRYEGEGVPMFWGGSTRLQADIRDWLELGLKISDDDIFHTSVVFNATVHMGEFRSQEHTSRSAMQRMAEPVRRNLNVTATVSDVIAGNQTAMVDDGSGGLRPLFIVHVDSAQTAAGIGTVESPFPSIQQGLNQVSDIVYTHAGSIFASAPDNQLILEAGKTLLGEGFITTAGGRETRNVVTLAEIGDLVLPRSPNFTGNESRPRMIGAGGDALTMKNNTRFGGFIVERPTGHGILSQNAADLRINDVTILEAGGNGIRFEIPTGSTTILDTDILRAAAGAFVVEGGDATIRYRSSAASGDRDPAFSNIENQSGPVISVTDTTDGAVVFTGTTITDTGGDGVIISGTGATPIAGDVTIDNLTVIGDPLVAAATTNGIAITNAAGQYVFRNTIRNSTTIRGTIGDSIIIDRLAPPGRVQFGDLDVSGSGGTGLSVLTNSGSVTFVGDVTMSAPVSTEPFIRVTGSVAGSLVEFSSGRSLTLDGTGATGGRAGGSGIELSLNEATSRFSALGNTDILFVNGRGVDIFSDASNITFGGAGPNDTLNIQEPGLEGIRIFQSTGPILFSNGTDVARLLAAVPPTALVDIQQTSGLVFFERLQANDLTGNTGVFLNGNAAGPNSLAKVSFTTLGIVTTGGTGLLANDNHEIETRLGTITSTNAPAVDITNSGIDIRLESVNSTNSPTFGIRLSDTNKDTDDNRGTLHPTRNKEFSIFGDNFAPGNNNGPGIGTGGTISGAAAEGILLVNGGRVTLFGMNLDDNNHGIRVINDLTDSTGAFREEDDQLLFVRRGNVIDSNVRGIETLNLTELIVQDTLFDNNGDVATAAGGVLTNETIFADYSQRPNPADTELIGQFDNPYRVSLLSNTFANSTDDTVFIDQQPTANDSHLIVETELNIFDHQESAPTRAIAVIWNGPVAIDINSDDFILAGLNEVGATAMFIEAESFTDQLLLTVRNTEIINTDQQSAIGLSVGTRTDAIIDIRDNAFTFEDFFSTGMVFNLGVNADVSLRNNGLDFLEQGGTGVDFNRIGAGSRFFIQDNVIRLADRLIGAGATLRPDDGPREEAMIFGIATGTYTIAGLRNSMFEVFPNNFQNLILPTFLSPPAAGNTIQVNGIFVP